MKIFITGASGYIGSAVAEAFARAGHSVAGLVRNDDKARALARHEITPIRGDMADPASFAAAASEAEVLVHCAFEYSAAAIEREKATLIALIDAGKAGRPSQSPQSLIYTSGVWVYGNTHGREADECSPLNPLGLVQWRVHSENWVLGAASARLRPVVIRPGCVYGGSGSLTGFWFGGAAKSGAAPIVGDGANRWAMVQRDDLARLYVKVAERELGGIILNAVGPVSATVKEMAGAASAAATKSAGADGKVRHLSPDESAKQFGPLAEGLAVDQRVSASRATRLTGWHPQHPGFLEGVERYYTAWQAAQAPAVKENHVDSAIIAR